MLIGLGTKRLVLVEIRAQGGRSASKQSRVKIIFVTTGLNCCIPIELALALPDALRQSASYKVPR